MKSLARDTVTLLKGEAKSKGLDVHTPDLKRSYLSHSSGRQGGCCRTFATIAEGHRGPWQTLLARISPRAKAAEGAG